MIELSEFSETLSMHFIMLAALSICFEYVIEMQSNVANEAKQRKPCVAIGAGVIYHRRIFMLSLRNHLEL